MAAASAQAQRADAALGLLWCPHQSYQVAEGVNHIVRLAMLEFCQATKAIGDGTGLEASRFPCQDVRCGIANHQCLLGSAAQRG